MKCGSVSYIELQMNKTEAKSEDVIKVRTIVGSRAEGVMKGRAYDILETVEHRNMEWCCAKETWYKVGSARLLKGKRYLKTFCWSGDISGPAGVDILSKE